MNKVYVNAIIHASSQRRDSGNEVASHTEMMNDVDYLFGWTCLVDDDLLGFIARRQFQFLN